MPIEFQTLNQNTGLSMVFSGILSETDVLAARSRFADAVTTDDRFRFCLVDLTGVTLVQIGTHEIKDAARGNQQLSTRTQDIAIAVIAPRDAVFGIARMWEMMSESIGWSTAVVRTREEAESWLNVVSETFRRDTRIEPTADHQAEPMANQR